MPTSVLSKIKPEYPRLVKYSKPDEALQELPDSQPSNSSKIVVDGPIRKVTAEQDIAWARVLRDAAAAA